jgi:biopolymer transport protein ExbD
MSGGGGEEGEFGLQIAPLLDVLFVLLLFFMVSAGSKERESELGVKLPGGGSIPGPVVTPATIDIAPDGQVYLNQARIDVRDDPLMPGLTQRLKTLIEQFGADQPVVITPAQQTAHQRVIDVLNACSRAQVKNLAFAAPRN